MKVEIDMCDTKIIIDALYCQLTNDLVHSGYKDEIRTLIDMLNKELRNEIKL